MIRIQKATVIAAIYTLLCIGCDGIFVTKYRVESMPGGFEMDNVYSQIYDVALSNGLACQWSYNDNTNLMCWGNSLNIWMKTPGTDKSVSFELRQFGPIGKTKQYKKVNSDIIDTIKIYPRYKVNEQ